MSAQLPPSHILGRWTVGDTLQWLTDNSLIEFRDVFRINGVDGNKISKMTNIDIDNFGVGSSKKRNLLKNAIISIDRSKLNAFPRSTGGRDNPFRREIEIPPAPPRRQSKANVEATRSPVIHNYPPNKIDDFSDDDDVYAWGENEFEDVEHTDNTRKGSNGKTPQQTPSWDHNEEDVYDEPHEETPKKGGIIATLQRELTFRKKGHVIASQQVEADDADDYIQPDAAADDDDDDYLEPEPCLLPPPRPPVYTAKSKPLDAPAPRAQQPIKLSPRNRRKKSLPNFPQPPVQEETYEVFETQPSLPPVPKMHNSHSTPSMHTQGRKSRYVQEDVVPGEEDYVDMEPLHKPAPKKRLPPVPPVPIPALRNEPPKHELDMYDWFHNEIGRKEASNKLEQHDQDGMFLVRISHSSIQDQVYTLMIYKGGVAFNLPIRRRRDNSKFALGQPCHNEIVFDTVPEIVNNYQKQLIKLNPAQKTPTSTKLVFPLPK